MRWKLADARSGERRAPITGGLRAKCEEMVQGGEIKGGARERIRAREFMAGGEGEGEGASINSARSGVIALRWTGRVR